MTTKKVLPAIDFCPYSTHQVDRNRIAFGVSVMMLLNVALMPMKAYFSEQLPWVVKPHQTFANFSEFNSTVLHQYQSLYSYERLHKAYFDDNENNTQVMRQVVHMKSHNDCTNLFLAGKPSGLMYGLSTRELLCDFAVANHSSDLDHWTNRGTCHRITYFAADIGFQCVWITKGNLLANFSKPHEYTITVAHTVAVYPTWPWIKLGYRISVTIMVSYLMWQKYYRHCLQLEHLLAKYGHRTKAPKGRWHYEIIWGDPTAIILMHPYVALALFTDCWLSVDTISLVIPRATQSDDISVMLVACVLKHYHLEHIFNEVDPTMVAVATTVFGPAMSWAMGNVGFLLQVYFFVFGCFIPAEYKDQQIDAAFPSVIYSFSIASLTLTYGFLGCSRPPASAQLAGSVNFSSTKFNGLKTRAIFFVMKLIHPHFSNPSPEQGGSVHHISSAIPRYKRSPTISFCSSDCFIHCYFSGNIAEKIRVTLLESLDRNLNNKEFAILDAVELSPFCVNTLRGTDADGTTKPQLHRSRHTTAWCI